MRSSFWLKLLISGVIMFFAVTAGLALTLSAVPASVNAADSIPRNAKTLIIDPGHGGADGGAVSLSGAYESAINLDISLKMRDLAGFFGIVPVMTRDSEELAYPEDATTIRAKKVADQRARVELITSTENAVLISIHQNKFTSASPKGAQVFYAGTEGSQELAVNMQELLLKYTTPTNRTASKIGSTIFLMNAVDCPAVLIECGFLSNPEESALLEDGNYQLKLAVIILGGYMGNMLT